MSKRAKGLDLNDPLRSLQSILRRLYFEDDVSAFFAHDGRLMTPDVVSEMERRRDAILSGDLSGEHNVHRRKILEREAGRINRKLRRYDLDIHRPNNFHKAFGLLEVASDSLPSPQKDQLDGMRSVLARLIEEYPLLRGHDRIGYPHVVAATLEVVLKLAVELLEEHPK
jgi:hypothetical protein